MNPSSHFSAARSLFCNVFVLLFVVAGLLLPSPVVLAQTTGAVGENASFDVMLSEMGPNKIALIKEVRGILPSLGLAAAKTLVESAPTPIKRGVTKAEAERIKQQLETAGAIVVVQSAAVLAGFDITFSSVGPDKLAAVLAVRDAVRGIGLADAKALVEHAPVVLIRGVTKEEADDVRQKIEATGSKVLVKEAAPAPGGDVILSEMGPNKISVIKEIRDVLPGMGLAEAKALVEHAPVTIKRAVTKDEADKIREKVETAGAKVTIKQN